MTKSEGRTKRLWPTVERASRQTSRKGGFLSALGGWKATAPCYVASDFVIRVSFVIRHSDFVILILERFALSTRRIFYKGACTSCRHL